jgi:heme exporter protein B
MKSNQSVPGAWLAIRGMLRRDLLLSYRNRGDSMNPLVFSLIVVTLFPLGIGPEPGVLRDIAPGLVWVVALLACLLSSERLFRDDFNDGSLQQLLLSPQPAYFMLLTRVLVHWLVAGLPVTLTSPLLALLLSMPASGYWPLLMALMLGTVSLSLIGAIGAALTVGLKRGGVLVALIVLPLYVPVLIFGAGAVKAGCLALPYGGHLAILAALMLLALVLAPLALVGALRINLDD